MFEVSALRCLVNRSLYTGSQLKLVQTLVQATILGKSDVKSQCKDMRSRLKQQTQKWSRHLKILCLRRTQWK